MDQDEIHRIAEGYRSERQAEREAKAARGDVQLAGARPALGFWLGLLAVILPVWAMWRSYKMYWVIWVMDPLFFEADALAFRVIILATATSILAAAGVAIHAILAGRTRRHLRRIVAMLWCIVVGTFLIPHTVVVGLLRARYGQQAELGDAAFVIGLVIAVIFASLWTAYLLRSRRCRLRYPKSPGESVLRVFE